jgi:dTDP-4-amino-4,6-dideoxygalactose transaminase
LRAGVREIPLSRPYLDTREEELVLEVLRSGRLSLGPAIDRFEELFAARDRYGFGDGLCPVAEDAASRTLALPFFTGIEADEPERVVAALSGAL